MGIGGQFGSHEQQRNAENTVQASHFRKALGLLNGENNAKYSGPLSKMEFLLVSSLCAKKNMQNASWVGNALPSPKAQRTCTFYASYIKKALGLLECEKCICNCGPYLILGFP